MLAPLRIEGVHLDDRRIAPEALGDAAYLVGAERNTMTPQIGAEVGVGCSRDAQALDGRRLLSQRQLTAAVR
jgi:hypothetical protein